VTTGAGAVEQQHESHTLFLACSLNQTSFPPLLPPRPHAGVAVPPEAVGSSKAGTGHASLFLSALHAPLPFSSPPPVQESPRALGRSSSSKASGAVGMSEEEAIAEQQKMFAEARAAMLNLQRPSS
ncbi:unnamed protein product, partial [Closterium sp. Naga37s-1]